MARSSKLIIRHCLHRGGVARGVVFKLESDGIDMAMLGEKWPRRNDRRRGWQMPAIKPRGGEKPWYGLNRGGWSMIEGICAPATPINVFFEVTNMTIHELTQHDLYSARLSACHRRGDQLDDSID